MQKLVIRLAVSFCTMILMLMALLFLPAKAESETPKGVSLTPTPGPAFISVCIGKSVDFSYEYEGRPKGCLWYVIEPNESFSGWENPVGSTALGEKYSVLFTKLGTWEVRESVQWWHRREDRGPNGEVLPTPTPREGEQNYVKPPPPGLNWKDVSIIFVIVEDCPVFEDGFEAGNLLNWDFNSH